MTADDGSFTPSTAVSYSDNTNAGTAQVSAGYFDPTEHDEGSNYTSTFTITKAPTSAGIACPNVVAHTGKAVEPFTAFLVLEGVSAPLLTIMYRDNIGPSKAFGDTNHLSGTTSATFTVVGFTLKGYYPPVRTLPTSTYWNVARAGSTVPLTFQAFAPNGTEITSTTTLGATLSTTRVDCTATPSTFPNAGPATSGDATTTYDTLSGQFVESWKTTKGVTGCSASPPPPPTTPSSPPTSSLSDLTGLPPATHHQPPPLLEVDPSALASRLYLQP